MKHIINYTFSIFFGLFLSTSSFAVDIDDNVSQAQESITDQAELSDLQQQTVADTDVAYAELVEQKRKTNILVNQYQQTVIDNPDDESTWYALARTLHDEGLHQDALYAASQALRFLPDDIKLNEIIFFSSLEMMSEPQYRGAMSDQEVLQAGANLEVQAAAYAERKKNRLAAKRWRKRQRYLKRQKRLRVAAAARKQKAKEKRAQAYQLAKAKKAKKAAARRAYAKKQAAKKRRTANKRKVRKATTKKTTKPVVAKAKSVTKPKPKKKSTGSDPFKSFR